MIRRSVRGRPLGLLLMVVLLMFNNLTTGQNNDVNGIVIEVENPPDSGHFELLDFSIVGTVSPTVRIRGDLPPGFRIFNDRPDGRAGIDGGINGNGKEITPLFNEVQMGTWRGTMGVLFGQNEFVVTNQDASVILASSMVLNFSPDFEDVNGNGLLDEHEDLNANLVLDAAEDLNDNGLLDFDEDLDNNQQLDTNEDLNHNDQLDSGEDLNGNGILDDEVIQPIAALLDETNIEQSPEGFLFHRTSIILHFVEGATDVEISEFLRTHQLRPNGLMVDDTVPGNPRMITADILDGTPAYILERTLNGVAVDDFTFPPPVPPQPPLALAVANLVAHFASQSRTVSTIDVAGERLPGRLINGAAPNGGEGYENNPVLQGSFDNNGGPRDELDIAWPHFFMETFAAHRLIDKLITGTPIRPGVAIIDGGFGNGVSAHLGDIGRSRLFGARNEALNWVFGDRLDSPSMRDVITAGGHGTSGAVFIGGDGSVNVLGIGKDVMVQPISVLGPSGAVTGTTTFSLVTSLANGLVHAAKDRQVHVVNLPWGFSGIDTDLDGFVENVINENGVGTDGSDPVGDVAGGNGPDDDGNWTLADDRDGNGVPSLDWDGPDRDANNDGNNSYDPEPHVDDDPPGSEDSRGRAKVQRGRTPFLMAINLLQANKKILIIAAGNSKNDAFFSYPGVFSIPRRNGAAIDDDVDGTADENAFPLRAGAGNFEGSAKRVRMHCSDG